MDESFLLDCPNYISYLDQYVTQSDRQYLRNNPVEHQLVQLNYRPKIRIYTKEEFLRRKQRINEQFAPENRRTLSFSNAIKINDPVLVELAARESPNKQKTLSTIIHLRYMNKNGFEISGFIDYADRLHQAVIMAKGCIDWTAVFEKSKMLRPQITDLSYYDWHKDKVFSNNTENYVVQHEVSGLIFMHRSDHKKLHVNANKSKMKANDYSRATLRSVLYGYVTFYDHVIHKKI